MAAALAINREEVRMLVISVGVAEAARITGINENTVKAWSARFGWIAALHEKPQLPASMVQPAPFLGATGATTVADLAVKAYRERRLKTRLLHSEVALENIEHLAAKPVDIRLADGGTTLMAVVKHAALADNWETESNSRVILNISGITEASSSLDAPTTLDIAPCDETDPAFT